MDGGSQRRSKRRSKRAGCRRHGPRKAPRRSDRRPPPLGARRRQYIKHHSAWQPATAPPDLPPDPIQLDVCPVACDNHAVSRPPGGSGGQRRQNQTPCDEETAWRARRGSGMAKRDEKATSETTTRTAQGNCDENDRTEEQGTEDMVRDETAGEAIDEIDVIGGESRAEGPVDNAIEDAWEELAEACLLAKDEEEIEELLGELSDDELNIFLKKYQEVIELTSNISSIPAESDHAHWLDCMVDGYIYLITNKINGKQYVGQTIQTVATRWSGHLSVARKQKHRAYSAIDRAIAKYGSENFTCVEIEHVQDTYRVLDSRERYWIRHFNTYVKANPEARQHGYNLTPGGEHKASSVSLQQEKEILAYYQSHISMTYKEIAIQCEVSVGILRSVLRKNGISKTPEEVRQSLRVLRGQVIEQYSIDGRVLVNSFASSHAAAEWILINVLHIAFDASSDREKIKTIAKRLRHAAWGNTVQYGYRWIIPSLSLEECEQKRNNYHKRLHESYKRYMTPERLYAREHSLGKRCPICNKPISNTAKTCLEHREIFKIDEIKQLSDLSVTIDAAHKLDDKNAESPSVRQQRIIDCKDASDDSSSQTSSDKIHLINGYHISYEEMQQLLRFMNLSEIGRLLGVSSNAVKKFAKNHFGIQVNRFQKFHIWNEQIECYEYAEELPLQRDEFDALVSQSGNINVVRLLARRFRIREHTMRKYLYMAFGEDYVRFKMAQLHTRCIDLTDGYVTENTNQMGRHILEMNHKELTANSIRVAGKYIERHLIKNREESVTYMSHIVRVLHPEQQDIHDIPELSND